MNLVVVFEQTRFQPTIRLATVDDAEAIAHLSDQLGYPSTGEEAARRLLEVTGRSGHAVFIAEVDGKQIGWLHIFVNYSLLADLPAEIAGLVVDENHRGRSVGQMLMQWAERWAEEQGCRSIRLRSNVLRSRAHTFYERLGYRIIKSQKAFCSSLPKKLRL